MFQNVGNRCKPRNIFKEILYWLIPENNSGNDKWDKSGSEKTIFTPILYL